MDTIDGPTAILRCFWWILNDTGYSNIVYNDFYDAIVVDGKFEITVVESMIVIKIATPFLKRVELDLNDPDSIDQMLTVLSDETADVVKLVDTQL